ncbi:MAG: SurA N-terminal domain-containing protein [Terracidiphilus sp.]
MQVESAFPVRARWVVFIVLSAAVLISVAGCHHTLSPDVVATVNNKEILGADLEKYYKARLEGVPQQPSPEQAGILRLNILQGLIQDEILQQRAAQFNLTASDEDVNAKITEMKAPYTQDEFDRSLQQHNQTLDDLKREVRRQLTTTKLLNKEIESKINITDAEISAYYNAHKAEFNYIEPKYHLAQILVTSAPSQQPGNLQNNKASSDADARKKIQVLHTKLDNGEDFGNIAVNYSEDKSTAASGGDTGFIADSDLHSQPAAYDAITKLKPGQYTDVVPFVDPQSHRTVGYAIYRLVSKEVAGQRELNDPSVQQLIRSGLREVRAQLLKDAYYEALRDDAKVHNYLADRILKDGAK